MNKKKILLIEDEPHQVMMVKFRLEANNFDFVAAGDGEEGLRKVDEEKPDLILLDLLMPKIDGYEVCRRLRRKRATKNIPVIFFTASVARDVKKKYSQYGANDCISKPFESEELMVKIKALLEKK